jgi:hypothetical protein
MNGDWPFVRIEMRIELLIAFIDAQIAIIDCRFKTIEKWPANRRRPMRVFTQTREFTYSDALRLPLSSTN